MRVDSVVRNNKYKMDYERTMKQYAQEIERTNRKIEMYLGHSQHQNPGVYTSAPISHLG